ncbi:ATP-binding protein [Tepidamorphus sp. 3E244]|uniref:ATP-binding protein n=1 Tax=Tepidamorphus sp. 3E244 TaxID=3385498 RepID=UPI0038FBFEF6
MLDPTPVSRTNDTQAPRREGTVSAFAQLWPAFAGAAIATGAFASVGTLALPVAIPLCLLLALAAWGLRRQAVNEANRNKTAVTIAEQAPAVDFARLISALPDAALLVDGDMRLRALNATATELLGEHAAGAPFSFAIRAPQVAEAVRSVRADLAPARVTYSAKVPDDRLLEAHVAPVPGEGDPSGFDVLIVLRDLTGQQRLERMRSDFIANASHELRTPLASVMGFIETLQGPAREDAVARERFLGIMSTQAARMARLIDDLMSLSRIEQKVHLRPSGRVDLVKTIGHVVDALQPIASENGVALIYDPPTDTSAFAVAGEPDELMQVFQNLIENAIKYGASGEKVEIAIVRRVHDRTKAGRIEARVRDFGPGIDPEHLPRLTERFYRADVATSRERGGTGLGLAIVKHILNRHRATLSISSVKGEGATFRVGFDPLS